MVTMRPNGVLRLLFYQKLLKQQGSFICTLTTIWHTLRRLGLTDD
jgi:hypothetical protein